MYNMSFYNKYESFYDKYFIKKKVKVNVISLNSPNELFKTLEKENLEPILIEAVDGSKLDYQTKADNTVLFYSLFGPNSSIAIAMSHMKAWEKILQSNENYGIIFEDDVILVPDFYNKFMTSMRKVPQNFDIFYLGCFGCHNNMNVLSTFFYSFGMANYDFRNVNNLINKPIVSLGLHAYVISKNGIKKIMEKLKGKIYFHLDFCIQQLIKDNIINVYSSNERLAFQTSTDQCISSNIKNNHPTLLNNLLSNFYIDEKCRANYLTTVSLYSLDDFNITASTIILILLGIHLAYRDFDFKQATLIYFLLSSFDLDFDFKTPKFKIFIVHYLFFIVPFLISKRDVI